MRTAIRFSKLVTLSLIMLLGVAFSLPTFAGTQLWDFEEKHDDWKVANGNWEIKGGVYHVERGGRAEHSLVGEEDWDDYTIEAKVRLDEHNWAGIVFRAQSEHEYYVYYLNVPSNIVELWQHNKGAWDTRENIAKTPAVGGVKIENEEWLDMMVVGVWAWETAASFDDFTVYGDNIIDTLAVDANDKLATTWGRLKRVY